MNWKRAKGSPIRSSGWTASRSVVVDASASAGAFTSREIGDRRSKRSANELLPDCYK